MKLARGIIGKDEKSRGSMVETVHGIDVAPEHKVEEMKMGSNVILCLA